MAKKITSKSKDASSYSKMNSLFRSHLAYFPYLPGNNYPFGSAVWLLRLIAWPDLIYGCIKFASLTVVTSFKVAVILGDFTWYMGSARFWYLVVCFLWTLIASGVRTVCYISTKNLRYQHWIEPMTILETVNDNPESVEDPQLTPDGNILPFMVKLTCTTLRFILCISYITGWSVNIPILLFFPVQYFPLTLFNSINTGFHGFLAAAWEVNFSIMLGFYLYYCGHRFNHINSTFLRSLAPMRRSNFLKKYNEGVNSKYPSRSARNLPSTLVDFQDNIITLCKEIKRSRIFWDKINNIIFIGTFLAETLLVYLMFFAKGVSGVMLLIIIWLGFLTFFYGQSINVIPAIYCQHKLDRCLSTLFSCVSSGVPMSINSKIKTLNTLEYLADDKILIVFWSLDANTWNYFKVQTEIAMLLLLLISNARS